MEPMTPVERERITNYLSDTRSKLLDTARGLSPEQLDFRSNPDRWSVAQIFEHLTIGENLIYGRISSALQSPPPSTQSAWQGRDEALVESIKDRSTRVESPERGRPASRWPHDELFRQFDAARARTIEFANTTSAPLRSFCFPHMVFGDLDGYQWLLAMCAHCERHHAQMLEVVADANFPRAAATA
jgi:uncharacterized damage-inducible protein DinB